MGYKHDRRHKEETENQNQTIETNPVAGNYSIGINLWTQHRLTVVCMKELWSVKQVYNMPLDIKSISGRNRLKIMLVSKRGETGEGLGWRSFFFPWYIMYSPPWV